MTRTTISLALASLMLTSCAAASGNTSGLADSKWRFVKIDGAAPVSQKAQLEFHQDRIGANAGCNGMGGPWRIENGRLIAGPLVQTMMYCDEPIMEQERAINALLAGAPEFRVQGKQMTLKSSGHSAELSKVN